MLYLAAHFVDGGQDGLRESYHWSACARRRVSGSPRRRRRTTHAARRLAALGAAPAASSRLALGWRTVAGEPLH